MGDLEFVMDFYKSVGIPKTVAGILSFMFAVYLVKGFIKYFERYYTVILRVGFAKKLRLELVDGLNRINYKSFLGIDAGRMQNVITGEIGKAVGAFTSYFTAMQTGVTLITYLVLAFAANFQFALLITVSGLLSQFIYRIFYKMVESSSYQQSLQGHGLQSYVIQSVAHFKYLKATGLIKPYTQFLRNKINEVEELSRKMGKLNAISTAMREPLVILIIVAVIYLQIEVLHSSLASIIVPLMLFYRALNNLMQVQTSWQSFLSSSGSISVINELYTDFKSGAEPTPTQNKLNFASAISLNNISFNYQSNQDSNVLSDVQVHIERNSTVAFVGESGSGKTTIINLIAGLLMPTKGTLTLDGEVISAANKDAYRQKVGYITQEPVIFNDTLFNNITFWSEPSTDVLEKFKDVLKQTALFDFVQELPDKEQTRLGDNGILISGGQKQRISIARELFRSSEILLMDEATSALDSETEKIIKENIDSLKGRYTIIIIAHRLSTVKEADVIYLMDKGRILDFGSFASLQQKNERFKRMVELQEF